AGGAELLTVHARWEGLETSPEQKWIPVVSVLRDTLGDLSPENDRLRYVWPLTYSRPTTWQRISGAVPFLYTRVGNKQTASGPPPPAIDLASPDREVWEKIFWTALQNMLLDPYGAPVKASTRSYRRNISDYRKSQIVRALSVLSLYQSTNGSAAFSEREMAEIQSRLLLTDKTFGGLLDELNLQRYYAKSMVQTRDQRGHNWELLRQRAEAESLYFEPLEMPDGSVTHALLWIAKSDLSSHRDEPYSKRFLNIDKPWGDKRLLNWQGYSETRYFDADSRPVAPETPGVRAEEMIPLALYGLDNPKIPMLLVDFRDGLNPKKREMSRRLLEDVTRNILSLSRFGDLPYFLGRSVYDFVTGRRGIDLNQPSRLRTYSQLKLLLALNESLDPELRNEITGRLEKVSLNPMENNLEAEAKLAQQQFAALLSYAAKPDGLPAKLERARRSEMVPLEHGKTEQVLFRLANILTFGRYVHREKATPEMESRLDLARRLQFHTNFLREVVRSTPQIDVNWDLEEVKRSLLFIAQHGPNANSQAINATAQIFKRTTDGDTRRACLESLARINKPKARLELMRISQSKDLDPALRELISGYLNNPNLRLEPLTSSIKANVNRTEQR
ncbi:MAG TPA: hypothetical protein VFV61_00990, partial [Pyrinomonadaceae bacterium]|nr:hypothetical protein [Pyrinomonadaceae bacterium]